MSEFQKIINSTPGQFVIGGLTVSGIGYFGNIVSNPALAALIAAVPIGMPSTVFIDNSKIEGYSYNLVLMTVVLLIASLSNWLLISKLKYDKYKSVSISLLVFIILGYSIVLSSKSKN
jgi:hypothetical protein